MTKQEAIKYLTERYNEQSLRWPLMRNYVPLELYIARNLRQAIRNAKERAKWVRR